MLNYYPPKPSKSPPTEPKQLPNSPLEGMHDPANYLADEGLVDAVNVALMLRQPLMVTGEPGTGKTLLAHSIAWELGLDSPLVFETKSTSTARDLFYHYDTLGRFTAKEFGSGGEKPEDFITYNALGQAIVHANKPSEVAHLLPSDYTHPGQKRSVVLIDEVEKAPRDFPNDILNEIERLYFRIPELGNVEVNADNSFDPVVILTNNSEKSLPDAFLRRCIFYHIPFPTGERLQQIVLARLPMYFNDDSQSVLMRDSISFVIHIRNESVNLEKPPGTSELLNWLSAMMNLGVNPEQSLADTAEKSIALRCIPSLVKISLDQEAVSALLHEWSDGEFS